MRSLYCIVLYCIVHCATYHIRMDVLINPLPAFFLEAKVEKIVSHFASHGMTAHDNGKTAALVVHGFDFLHRLGQISIPCFGAHGWQSPAVRHKKKENVRKESS